MLGAIALLGSSVKIDSVKNLADKTGVKEVFVINLNSKCKYAKFSVEKNAGEDRYLYRREKGGLPGKFITGRIGAFDVRNLKKLITQNSGNYSKISKDSDFKNFVKKKIAWIDRPSILKDEAALGRIPKSSQRILESLVNEIMKKQDRIAKDFCKKLSKGEYSEILVTVKIGTKYLKDIEGFSDLFRMAAQGGDVNEHESGEESTHTCMICNNPASRRELKEPLPFFTLDKPNFLPGGSKYNFHKAFPLCVKCYGNLQKGSRYVMENMLFAIPNTSGSSRIFFWLVPVLSDPSLVKDYFTKSPKGLASFKEMMKMFLGLELARKIDTINQQPEYHEIAENDVASRFLSYVAIFHYYDKQKNMRLLGHAEGIYPPRLRELAEAKYLVDKIAYSSGSKLKFHFGLMTDFIEKDTEGWMRTMTHIMTNVFTGRPIDIRLIVKILMDRAKDPFRKRDLATWNEEMLKATILLEYLYRVKAIVSENSVEKTTLPEEEKSKAAAGFLNSHSGILYTKNLRAICSIGLAIGIVVKAQQRYMRSDSFLSRLGRLEMDYPRLQSLFPQALLKLKHYKAEEYTDLVSYLGSSEISNLDVSQKVPEELMNLVFAVGMCQGFTMFKSAAKNPETQVTQA